MDPFIFGGSIWLVFEGIVLMYCGLFVKKLKSGKESVIARMNVHPRFAYLSLGAASILIGAAVFLLFQ